MNAQPPTLAEPDLPREGWSRGRWIFLILFVFAAHLALIFLFGSPKKQASRVATMVPQLQIADGTSELIALADPTLFALPHLNDFAPAAWLRPPEVQQPFFRPVEQTPSLLEKPAVETLGMAFHTFMQTNQFTLLPLDFKPDAQLAAPVAKIESALPQNSTLQVAGEIKRRQMLNALSIPSLAYNDVIKPSRVQVLVDADGNVASVALLETSDWDGADQKALELARTARFAPAAGLMFGELIFNWHTVPVTAP